MELTILLIHHIFDAS